MTDPLEIRANFQQTFPCIICFIRLVKGVWFAASMRVMENHNNIFPKNIKQIPTLELQKHLVIKHLQTRGKGLAGDAVSHFAVSNKPSPRRPQHQAASLDSASIRSDVRSQRPKVRNKDDKAGGKPGAPEDNISFRKVSK